jgi:hypothetical protein
MPAVYTALALQAGQVSEATAVASVRDGCAGWPLSVPPLQPAMALPTSASIR